MSRGHAIALRALDISVALGGIFVTSPLLIALAIFIRSRREQRAGAPPESTIFSQTRLGRAGKPFQIYKFRSMRSFGSEQLEDVGYSSAEAKRAPAVSADNDPRIEPWGRALRRWRLDELPQLWNLLRGDMSLVGPRPEVPEFRDDYERCASELWSVRPGLVDPATLASLDEGRELAESTDPEAHYRRVILPRKLAASIRYHRHRSFVSDLGVLVRCAGKLLFFAKSR